MEENRFESLEDLRNAFDNGSIDFGASEAESVTESEEVAEPGTESADGTPAEGAESGTSTEASAESGTEPLPGSEAVPAPSPAQSYEQVVGAVAARDREAELQAEVNALRAQLAESQQREQANANAAQQNIAEQLSDSKAPAFDSEAFAYASDEDRARMLAEYNSALMASAEQRIMQRLAPVVEQYDREYEQNVFDNTINELSTLEQFKDVADMKEDIYGISKMREFKDMPVKQRVAQAALIAKGLRAIRPEPPKAAPDINTQVDEIFANPELMKAIEARRLKDAGSSPSQSIPVHSASGSLSSAAYHAPEKPQSIEELKAKYGII